MVVRKRKKILKKRGHRGVGHGSQKKHRGSGSRGGSGLAGLHKHKIMTMIKYMPDHFGKEGFKRPFAKKLKTINLSDLDRKLGELLAESKIEESKTGIKVNLSELGYDKLLGGGKITKKLIVEGKAFSKHAIRKIEEVGGKTVVVD